MRGPFKGGLRFHPDVNLGETRALAHVRETGAPAGLDGTTPITNAELLELPCEILIPAALEGTTTPRPFGPVL